MPPSADTLHVYATTLLISAVCTSVLLDCAAWSTPPMLHMYMADVMPVEAVWQVKLKLLPSSTVPEALLVMVGVWGTTAQKHNKHRLFHIQALQPCTYTFRTLARKPLFAKLYSLSVNAQCYTPTSNVDGNPLPPIPFQMLQNKRSHNKSRLFTSLLFPLGTTSGPRLPLQPNSSPHTYVSSESGHRALSQDSLQPYFTLTVTHWPHTHTQTHT